MNTSRIAFQSKAFPISVHISDNITCVVTDAAEFIPSTDLAFLLLEIGQASLNHLTEISTSDMFLVYIEFRRSHLKTY